MKKTLVKDSHSEKRWGYTGKIKYYGVIYKVINGMVRFFLNLLTL